MMGLLRRLLGRDDGDARSVLVRARSALVDVASGKSCGPVKENDIEAALDAGEPEIALDLLAELGRELESQQVKLPECFWADMRKAASMLSCEYLIDDAANRGTPPYNEVVVKYRKLVKQGLAPQEVAALLVRSKLAAPTTVRLLRELYGLGLREAYRHMAAAKASQ